MNTVRTDRIDGPQLLSLLWIFLLLSFIYCDIIVLHDAGVLQDLITGDAGAIAVTVTVTPTFLLLVSLLMEIPIALVLVSRLAPRTPNRIANIAAGRS